ncbi:MAG: hypothetical protein ACXAAT_20070, partial [Candidatus Hodarchaeales archaeon]
MLEKRGIYCYKVKKGQEFNAAEGIAQFAEVQKLDVTSVLVTEIQGYLFIEGH